MSNTKFNEVILDRINRTLDRIEPVLIITILGILAVFTFTEVNGGIKIIANVLLSTIGVFYMMSAYKKLPEDTDVLVRFSQKLGGFSSAMALIGVLFVLLEFPGPKPMLIAGGMGILLVLGLILVKNQIEVIGSWVVIRLSFLLAVIIYLFAIGVIS